jgi:hypothetical protein
MYNILRVVLRYIIIYGDTLYRWKVLRNQALVSEEEKIYYNKENMDNNDTTIDVRKEKKEKLFDESDWGAGTIDHFSLYTIIHYIFKWNNRYFDDKINGLFVKRLILYNSENDIKKEEIIGAPKEMMIIMILVMITFKI